jgi:glutaredoxin
MEGSNSSRYTKNVPSTGNTDISSVLLGCLVAFIVLLIIFGTWGTCTEKGKSTFANIKTKMGFGSKSLKEFELLMFISPTCPWCKKMIGVLDSEGQLNNVTVVDISKEEGANLAKQFGADKQPVPSFISRKLKTGTVGYRDSVAKLIEALKPPANKSIQQEQGNSDEAPSMHEPINIENLQIILFSREGCPWCTKAKEACNQAGVADVIQIVDITTPEGQELAGKVLPPGTSGVPAWFSMATKKHVVGFKPIEQLVQELQ